MIIRLYKTKDDSIHMEIRKISRVYRQSVQVILPDGRQAWLAHEAGVDAVVNEDDVQDLGACYDELEAIAKSEVSTSLKAQQDLIKSATVAGRQSTTSPRARI